MEKKTYTLSVEITSSSFPNHPHLAVAVAKKMWSLGHDTQSISNQIGTPTKTILQIARLEEWKRDKRELPETDFRGTDDPEAVKPEEPYRGKYKEHQSASSTLAWIDDL